MVRVGARRTLPAWEAVDVRTTCLYRGRGRMLIDLYALAWQEVVEKQSDESSTHSWVCSHICLRQS